MCDDPTRRSATSTGSPSSTRSTSTTSPRAIELYREILAAPGRSRADARGPRGLKSGDKDPLGAAAVLEPVYEAASDWPKLISVLEVQVAHADDPFHEGRPPPPHRAALRGRAREPRVGVRHVRARARRSTTATRTTLQNLERLAMVVNRWPQVAALYDAELDKLAENPERFVELGLRLAQIFEVQLEDVDNAVGALPARARGRAREPDRRSLARSALRRRPSAGRELAAILAREAEIGQTPDEILEFKYRLGQVQQHRLSDLDAAIAAYRDVLSAAPEHEATLEALEGLFAARHQAGRDRRDPRAALPRGRRVGEARRRLRGAARAHRRTRRRRRAPRHVLPHRRAPRREAHRPGAARSTSTSARSRSSRSTRSRGEEVERLAGIDRRRLGDARQRLRRRARPPRGPERPAHDRPSPRARRSRTSSATSTRPRRRTATCSASRRSTPRRSPNLDRIYLVDRAVGRARAASSRARQGAGRRRSSWSSSTRASARSTRSGSRDIPNATVAFRRIFDGLDKTHDGAIQALARIYRAEELVAGAQHGLRARARERVGRRRRRRRSARRSRTSPPSA